MSDRVAICVLCGTPTYETRVEIASYDAPHSPEWPIRRGPGGSACSWACAAAWAAEQARRAAEPITDPF